MNEVIKKYKIFNNKIIKATKFGINISKNNKNELMKINELLNNEFKNFYDSQNIKKTKIIQIKTLL